jgi:hypothetical protein
MGPSYSKYYSQSYQKQENETQEDNKPLPVTQNESRQVPEAIQPKPETKPIIPSAYPDLATTTMSTTYDVIPIREGWQNVADGDPQLTDGNTVYNDQTKLLNKIIEFNKLYARYIHCQTEVSQRSTSASLGNCSSNQPNDPNYSPSRDELIAKQTEVDSAINLLKNTGFGKSSTTFPVMLQNNNDMLALRNQLDIKLKELYRTEDSLSNEYKKTFDSTIYAEILLCTLATSILYYVFVKL